MRLTTLMRTTLLTLALIVGHDNISWATHHEDPDMPFKRVHLSSGSLILAEEDMSIPDTPLPLSMVRYYHSGNQDDGRFGVGWMHSWEIRLSEAPGKKSYFLWSPGGSLLKLVQNNQEYRPERSAFPRLQKTPTGELLLTERGGLSYRFDKLGSLMEVKDGNGTSLTLRYQDGRLVSIHDRYGRSLQLEHNPAGRITSLRDPANRTYSYEYDDRENLVKVVYPGGVVTTYSYDTKGRLVGIQSPAKGKQVFAYNSSGKVTQEEGPGAYKASYRYTSEGDGRQVTVIFGTGKKVVYQFREDGSQAIKIDGAGRKTVLEYDSKTHALIRKVDHRGNTTTYGYNADGDLLTVSDPKGKTSLTMDQTSGLVSEIKTPSMNHITFSRDSSGNLQSVKSSTGAELRYKRDMNGLATSIVNPLGGETTFSYDQFGYPATIRDPLGFTTHQEFDPLGRLVAVTNSKKDQFSFHYNNRGALLSVTGSKGSVLEMQYDASGVPSSVASIGSGKLELARDTASGRVKSVKRNGTDTQFEYDAAGLLRRLTSDGTHVSFEYDMLGRLMAIEDTKGGRRTFAFDSKHRLLSQEINGATKTYSYNSQGFLSEVKWPSGGITRYEYHPAGFLNAMIDPMGGKWLYEHDVDARLLTVTDPGKSRAEYQYNGMGLTTQVLAPGRRMTRLNYNLRGELVETVDPWGGKTGYQRDGSGQVVSIVNPLGVTTKYQYDDWGRLVSKIGGKGERWDFKYDAFGNLTEASSADLAISYQYDTKGRVTKTSYPKWGKAISYRYDAKGHLIERKGPGDCVAKYGYDPKGRLATVRWCSGTSVSFSYNLSGERIAVRYPNGVVTEYQRNKEGRITAISGKKNDGSALLNLSYKYNMLGNRIEGQRDSKTLEHFAYDSSSRLRAVEVGGKVTTFDYSESGDRLAMKDGGNEITYEYDSGGLLRRAGATRYEYDAAGNLAVKHEGGQITRYYYDPENRLIRADLPGGDTIQFGYGPFGERLWKKEKGTTTYYVYDGKNLVAEMDDKFHERVSYLYGPWLDEPFLMKRGKEIFSFHLDGIGSVLLLTDSKGEAAASYRYDSFGDILEHQGSVKSSVTYTSREFEPALGLYYYRSRFYEPKVGRFISSDPFPGIKENPQSLNRYAYVSNNPLTFRDPDGLQPQSPWLQEYDPVGELIGARNQVDSPGTETSRALGAFVRPPEEYDTRIDVNNVGEIAIDKNHQISEIVVKPSSWKSGPFTPEFAFNPQDPFTHIKMGFSIEGQWKELGLAGEVKAGLTISKESTPEDYYAGEQQVSTHPILRPVEGLISKVDVYYGGAAGVDPAALKPSLKHTRGLTNVGGESSWSLRNTWTEFAIAPQNEWDQKEKEESKFKMEWIKDKITKEAIRIGIDKKDLSGKSIREIRDMVHKEWTRDPKQVKPTFVKERPPKPDPETSEQTEERTDKDAKAVDKNKGKDLGYNPLTDANLKSGMKESINIAEAEKLADEFQKSERGGTKSATAQGPQNVMKQPESYTTDPGAKPDAPGGTQQPPFYPYPPGYLPESGQPGPRIPWQGLVPPSSGPRGKTSGRTSGQKGGTPSPHGSSSSSSATSSRPPQSGSGGHVKEQPCSQCQAWASGIECGRAKRRDPSIQCIMDQQQVGNCYYRAWEEGLRKGMGLTNTPKPEGC